jgi:acetylornithine deacetylase/succinyl-diaminopimelate desuccinylase-like protein
MSHLQQALDYAQSSQAKALDELVELLRIPSVSTLPEHESDMSDAAAWLAARLESLGFEAVQVMPTGGHPVVYAESLNAGPDAPTVLVYGHYDVQPADPLELWESGPFEPEVRDGNLYARGASDMKGQVVAHLRAVEALTETGSLPVNIKYLLEGEEEIGSPNLGAYIEQNRELFAADFCLNMDAGIIAPDVPSITYALRGLAYFDIRVQGPAGDLHSGTFGGAVVNPANALARLIGGMHDELGRVTLPGFYDDVKPLTDEERADLAQSPQTETWWSTRSGAEVLGGEDGFTATERATARPTLDVNGLNSGFTGEGSKTVLPAVATAKISCRLVADQNPDTIHQSLLSYMEANAPKGISWGVNALAGAAPAIIDRDSPEVSAARQALKEVWETEARYKREGGTVPVVAMIEEMLELKTLMLGFGLPDDNLHAPNEKFLIANYHRGIDTFIRFMSGLAA